MDHKGHTDHTDHTGHTGHTNRTDQILIPVQCQHTTNHLVLPVEGEEEPSSPAVAAVPVERTELREVLVVLPIASMAEALIQKNNPDSTTAAASAVSCCKTISRRLVSANSWLGYYPVPGAAAMSVHRTELREVRTVYGPFCRSRGSLAWVVGVKDDAFDTPIPALYNCASHHIYSRRFHNCHIYFVFLNGVSSGRSVGSAIIIYKIRSFNGNGEIFQYIVV